MDLVRQAPSSSSSHPSGSCQKKKTVKQNRHIIISQPAAHSTHEQVGFPHEKRIAKVKMGEGKKKKALLLVTTLFFFWEKTGGVGGV